MNRAEPMVKKLLAPRSRFSQVMRVPWNEERRRMTLHWPLSPALTQGFRPASGWMDRRRREQGCCCLQVTQKMSKNWEVYIILKLFKVSIPTSHLFSVSTLAPCFFFFSFFDFKIVLILRQYIHCLAPNYILDLLSRDNPLCSLRVLRQRSSGFSKIQTEK